MDVKLSEVELSKPEALPIGTYTFLLVPGAEYRVNKFNGIEELNVSAAVTDGDLAGRRTFFNYPDPTAKSASGKSMQWSAQALKKLEIALGIDSLPGEDPLTYINRAASTGNARFTASIDDASYTDKEGKVVAKASFNIFSVAPSA